MSHSRISRTGWEEASCLVVYKPQKNRKFDPHNEPKFYDGSNEEELKKLEEEVGTQL